MDPRIYRMAPEYRRSAIYGLICCVLVGAWIPIFGSPFDTERERDAAGSGFNTLVIPYALLLSIASYLLIALHWSLRVDGAGIARRWLLRSDFWAWDEFASGRITKHEFTFFDPNRAWWSNGLNIGHLTQPELKTLLCLINQHYRLPAAPMMPEHLQVGYGFRRTVKLDQHEIRLKVRGEAFHFAWSDVRRLHITRHDPLRRDFTSIELVLPGHEIELRCDGTTAPWNGPSAEDLSEFLCAHVPADRIDVDFYGERPNRAEDVRKRLDSECYEYRATRICISVCALALATLTVWIAIDNGLLHALAIAGATIVFLIPLAWVGQRELRKRTDQLRTWLAELENRQGYPAAKES